MLLDSPIIGDNIDRVNYQHGDQQYAPQAHAEEQRHTRDILSHAYGKRIHQTSCESSNRPYCYHGHTGYLIQPQSQGHGNSDGHENRNFVGHSHGSAKYCKQRQENGYHEYLFTLQMPAHGPAQGQYRTAGVYQLKGASDNQQESDYIRRIQDSIVHQHMQGISRVSSR